MERDNFYNIIKLILKEDSRYSIGGYEFVNNALLYTVRKTKEDSKIANFRHIKAEELIYGVVEFSIRQFGPLAYEVLSSWGIKNTIDIGNIVFNMVEFGLLSKSKDDNIDDFVGKINLKQSIKKEFIPDCALEVEVPVIDK